MNNLVKRSFFIGLLLVNFDQLHASHENNDIWNSCSQLAKYILATITLGTCVKIGNIYLEKPLRALGLQTDPDMPKIKIEHVVTFQDDSAPHFHVKQARDDHKKKESEKRYIAADGRILKDCKEYLEKGSFFSLNSTKSRKLNENYSTKPTAISESRWKKPKNILNELYGNTKSCLSFATLGLYPEFVEASEKKFKQKCDAIDSQLDDDLFEELTEAKSNVRNEFRKVLLDIKRHNSDSKGDSNGDSKYEQATLKKFYENYKLEKKVNEARRCFEKAFDAAAYTSIAGIGALVVTTELMKHYCFNNK